MDFEAMAREATDILVRLVRFNTTNPPGNETPAAKFIAELLEKEGIKAQVLESEPGRGNVVARLEGSGEKGPLLLLSHLDVVPAEKEKWKFDPFEGKIHDGFVWGRGTLDTKELTAVQIVTLLTLKREGIKLKRDVILAATADEEMGGEKGIGWLLDKHPELLKCEYALNEGGGIGVRVNGRTIFLIQTAEKGILWLRLKAKGKPGHASTPPATTAVTKLIEALNGITHHRSPLRLTRTVREFLNRMASVQKAPAGLAIRMLKCPIWSRAILKALQKKDQQLAGLLNAMLHNTASVTILRAGEKTNVIPSEAEAQVDCRLLPGQTKEDMLRELRPYLEGIEVEVVKQSKPWESDYRSPLYETISKVLSEEVKGSQPLPFMLTGSTDGRYLVERGVKVYGFFPVLQDTDEPILQLVHGHNERISLKNIAFAVRTYYKIVREFVS